MPDTKVLLVDTQGRPGWQQPDQLNTAIDKNLPFSSCYFDKIVYNYNNDINNVVFVGGYMLQNINDMLDWAVQETHKLNTGEIFLIRDLFKGYEWNRISRSNRLLLGTLFLNRIRYEKAGIQIIEKTTSGQQKYKKI